MLTIKNKKVKYIIIVSFLIFLALFIYSILKASSTEVVSAKKFNELLEKSSSKKIYIKDKYIYLDTKDGLYKSALSGVDSKKILKEYPVEVFSKSSNILVSVAVFLLLSILVTLLFILRRDKSSVSNKELLLSKDSTIKDDIKPQFNKDISFEHIAGISEIKDDIKEIVDFLKNPLKYKRLNIKMPKGVLLVGPPGVGKTLIAKAISSEAGVPFFYHSGANFVQIYAGMGAKRVKELFDVAKKSAPSIIFIDEIDAVGKSRDRLNSDEREATLNQLLVEMDGFEKNNAVVVIGATNRLDILDNALLRPGRFDRRLFIDLPNINEREQILNLYLKDKKFNFDIKEVASITAGFSPAALETLINEASLNAFREGKSVISLDDIYAVKDRVIFGKRKIPLLSKVEKEIQAKYLTTKAVTAFWLGFNFDKVNFLSKLNFTQDRAIESKNSLKNRALVLLSGILFLEKEFNNSFSIFIEDKNELTFLIDKINKDYSFLEPQKVTLDSLIEELEPILDRFKELILELSKEMLTKESLSYSDIEQKVDKL